MKTRVKWDEERSFIGTASTGHKIAFGAAGSDGTKPGPSPMELMLLGTGGCSAYDVVSILEKSRQKIDGVEVELDAERAETDPKVFERIHMHFIVSGRELDPARVARALSLSIDKYCSASAMMAKSAELTYDFEIVDTSA
jgi:putative redox protein